MKELKQSDYRRWLIRGLESEFDLNEVMLIESWDSNRKLDIHEFLLAVVLGFDITLADFSLFREFEGSGNYST